MTKIEELKDYITRSLVKKYPESNQKNIERYLTRRMQAILKDVLPIAVSRTAHAHYANDDSVKFFNSTQYRKSWGQMTLNSKRIEAATELLPILFRVLQKGVTGIATAIEIKERTMDALMEYAIEQDDDVHWVRKFDFSGLETYSTAIDVASLRKYVEQLESDSTPIADAKKRNEKLRNIYTSKTILASLVAEPGPVMYGKQQSDIYVLVQEATIVDSSRLYLKGLNLQSCPKAVRHAALGNCHLYDMRAGVFGVMAGLAKAYCKSAAGKDIEFHKIKDYVLHRNEVRARITRQLWQVESAQYRDDKALKSFYGFKKVKEALTAISFGAKRTGNASWKDARGNWKSTSLRDTFKDAAKVEQFLQMPVVKELLDEFKEVSKLVLLQLDQDSDFAAHFPIDGLKDSQKLAMVYQGTEARIMAELLNHISDYGVLLPVHDGVYVKQRFDLHSVHFQIKLPFGIDKSYIQFDCSQIGLATPLDFEEKHRSGILNEGIEAANYNSTHYGMSSGPAVAIPSKQVMTNWGLVDAELAPIDLENKPKYQHEE